MNRHVGASFTLSVLVVIFFAIVLYEPDHSRPDSRAKTPATASNPTHSPGSEPAPPLIDSTSEPLLEATRRLPPSSEVESPEALASASTSASASTLTSTPASKTAPRPRPTASVEPPTAIHRVSRQLAERPGRHSAFTQVGPGETLADVALRIYGTSEATHNLWRANRDILAHRDAPLSKGLLLRTPE